MWASSPDVMMRVLVFEPTGRHGYRTVTRQDRVDLFHVGATDFPAERAEIFSHLARRAETDQRRADNRVAQSPAQSELRQGLAVFGRKRPQLLDSGEVALEMLAAEQRAEQVQTPEIAAFRTPVALVEGHPVMERAAQHAVGKRSVRHHPDLFGPAIGKDLRLHAAVEHVPGVLHDVDAAQPHRLCDLRQTEIRHADITRLALPYDVVERGHRLVERRIGIGPMYEINFDMVGSEPPQALVDRREDARPAAVTAVWHFLVADAEFGCDHDIVAASP